MVPNFTIWMGVERGWQQSFFKHCWLVWDRREPKRSGSLFELRDWRVVIAVGDTMLLWGGKCKDCGRKFANRTMDQCSVCAVAEQSKRNNPKFEIGDMVTSEVMVLTSLGFARKLKQPWIIKERRWFNGGDGYKWWYGTDADGAVYVESALQLADAKQSPSDYV